MKKIVSLFSCMLLILMAGCSNEDEMILSGVGEPENSMEAKAAVVYDYYVATNGSDANTGTEAVKPFKTIQKALNMGRKVSSRANKIKVADGTYYEAITIQSGGELEGNIQNPGKVIISATGKNKPVINTYYSAIINGFTLTGATVSGYDIVGGYDGYGAGVHISHGLIEIKNCIITGNKATAWTGASAIKTVGGGSFEISNTQIYNNIGDVVIRNVNVNSSIRSSTIRDNIGYVTGGTDVFYVIYVSGEKLYIMDSVINNPNSRREIYGEETQMAYIGLSNVKIRGRLANVGGSIYYMGGTSTVYDYP
ncbi:MAG: hypothetical protein ACK5KT_11590 [Dysgonomonas sp.]